jgi:hypothetical protein
MAAYSGNDSKLLYFVFREGEFEGNLSEVALSTQILAAKEARWECTRQERPHEKGHKL